MSFLGALKSIGHAIAGIEPTAVTILKLFPVTAPAAGLIDGLFHTIQGAVVTAEAQSPVGGGQIKSQAVIADFQAGLQVTQSVLALEHKTLTYDADKLQAVINAQVAALNAFAELKASFKIEDAPK